MSTAAFPPLHIIPPPSTHTHTIIFLHGRGATGPTFATELFESETSNNILLADYFPHTRWVFPSSRIRHSTPFDEDMSTWYDAYSLTDPSVREELQYQGMAESIAHVRDVVSAEASAVGGGENVALCGISQGCATGLIALLAGVKVGAFVGMCGWVPVRERLEETVEEALVEARQEALRSIYERVLGMRVDGSVSLQTPVFLSHSADDDIVDVELGRAARDTLVRLGLPVTWKEYGDGGHWVQEPQGVDDFVPFLQERGFQ